MGSCTNEMKSNQYMLNLIGFWREGKTEVPGEKNSWSRVENQQTQPTYDAGSGNQIWVTLVGGKCSHHCAIPPPQKQGNHVGETLLQKQMFRHLRPQETFVAQPKMFLNLLWNILLPRQMFPCLCAKETFWETMFPCLWVPLHKVREFSSWSSHLGPSSRVWRSVMADQEIQKM